MIISVATLSILVSGALIITVAAPIILLTLFIRDKTQGKLW